MKQKQGKQGKQGKEYHAKGTLLTHTDATIQRIYTEGFNSPALALDSLIEKAKEEGCDIIEAHIYQAQ